MFEDSLVESGGKVKSKIGRSVMVSTIVQVGVVIALILYPLAAYSKIEAQRLESMLVAPPPPPAAPPPPPPAGGGQTTRVVVEQLQAEPNVLVIPRAIPKQIARFIDEGPMNSTGLTGGVPGGSPGGGPGGILGGSGSPGGSGTPIGVPDVTPPPPPPPPPPSPPTPSSSRTEPTRVSQGVLQGSLIRRPDLVYPALARQARVQGQVVIEATIGKDGRIDQARVISGHPLLSQGALDNVKQWVYRPYLLNGEPAEVVTTITVNFAFQ